MFIRGHRQPAAAEVTNATHLEHMFEDVAAEGYIWPHERQQRHSRLHAQGGARPASAHDLDVIRASVTTRGYPPSIREIGDAVGLTSTSSVAHQLRTLERKGYLRRDPNRPRAVDVRGADEAAGPTRHHRPSLGWGHTAGNRRSCRCSDASLPAGRSSPKKRSKTCSRSPRTGRRGLAVPAQGGRRVDGRRRDLRRRLGGGPAAERPPTTATSSRR